MSRYSMFAMMRVFNCIIGPVLSFSCHFYVISSCSSSLNSSHPRNQILKMSHSGIADFPALTVPVPRAPYITTAHLGQRHQPKAYNLVAFQVNEEWLTMVNPSFDFFSAKLRPFYSFATKLYATREGM